MYICIYIYYASAENVQKSDSISELYVLHITHYVAYSHTINLQNAHRLRPVAPVTFHQSLMRKRLDCHAADLKTETLFLHLYPPYHLRCFRSDS